MVVVLEPVARQEERPDGAPDYMPGYWPCFWQRRVTHVSSEVAPLSLLVDAG